MIKEKQLQTQHLIIKMANDKCLTILHSWCLAPHIHVVTIAHLNNFSETQTRDEPEVPTPWVTAVQLPQDIVAVCYL